MNKNLVIVRKENDMNQEQLAELLGITRQAYHLKETGKSDFRQTEMYRLSRIFDKTLDELFAQEVMQ